MFLLETLGKPPTVTDLSDLRKSDWQSLAEYYQIPVKAALRNTEIKELILQVLVRKKWLPKEAFNYVKV